MLRKIALLLTAVAAIACVVTGFRYVLASEFMPYHSQVVGSSWVQLDPRIQAIVLGMLTIIGASFIAAGLTQLWLLIPLRRTERWAAWASLTIALALWVPTQYVTVYLRTVEPAAETPVVPTAILIALFVLGSLCHFAVSYRARNEG